MRCNVKNLINLFINFIKRLFNVQTLSDSPAESNAEDGRPIKKHSPPWWKRLYGVETRGEVPKNSFQPIKPFGNFKAVQPLYKPRWYK